MRKKSKLQRKRKPIVRNFRPTTVAAVCEKVLNELVTSVCDEEICDDVLQGLISDVERNESTSSRKLKRVVQECATKKRKRNENEVENTEKVGSGKEEEEQEKNEDPYAIVDICHLKENLQSVACCKICGEDISVQVRGRGKGNHLIYY